MIKRSSISVLYCCALTWSLHASSTAFAQAEWLQWGQNPQHSGFTPVAGQPLGAQLGDFVYDPFVREEQAEQGGDLLTHYQAPLTSGIDVYMEFETGTWVACDPPGSGIPPEGEPACGTDSWDLKIWNEKKLTWMNGELIEQWSFASDWKPEPDAGFLGGWEPVFHAALAGSSVYVPGAGGSIFKVDKDTGNLVGRINPFGPDIDPNKFVSSPLTVDAAGNIYYNVIQLDAADPYAIFNTDIPGAWLVKVSASGTASMFNYKSLNVTPAAGCKSAFSTARLPWPPNAGANDPTKPADPTATPATVACLSQRPGINITPAIAPDGTIYTVSSAHNPRASRYTYVVALNPNLTFKWSASMRDRVNNGCNNDTGTFPGSLLPASGTPGGCRKGATPGVDPATNEKPAGRMIDQGSSSPTVDAEGNVLYGSYARYNYARGLLFKFDKNGNFKAAYDFGWDSTPATFAHNGTVSYVIKDNHYDAGSYCNSAVYCPTAPQGPYYITQLNANLVPEWKFKNTETRSCARADDGTMTCTVTHPNGFEWCINAPAVDANGVVYANSEDGNLYTIKPDGSQKERFFLQVAIGAAYTPLAVGGDGKIYTENDGHMFVVGASTD